MKILQKRVCELNHRDILVLHVITEESPWCKSCVENSATGFERFLQIPITTFSSKNVPLRIDEKRMENYPDYSQVLRQIKEADVEWILLLFGNIGIEKDFLFQIQYDIADNENSDAIIYGEYSSVDGTAIRFPQEVKSASHDLFGMVPSNLLIRRSALLEILSDCGNVFLPNPIVVVLKRLIEKGKQITAGSGMQIIHNAPMNCSMIDYDNLLKRRDETKRRILIMTHELTRTGAPIVLFEACANVLLNEGYELFLVSPTDGPLAKDFLNAGIPVMICPGIMDESHMATVSLAMGFDLVIANTNVLWAPICALNIVGKPVLWWIHDAEVGYQWVAPYMPDRLGDSIHVYCVGQHAINALIKHKPLYNPVYNMIYGIEDQGENKERTFKDSTCGVCEFVCSGSITERKGQDILCTAIETLTDEERRRCHFTIVGKSLDQHILEIVKSTCAAYPDCMEYHEEMPRNEVYRLYANADCIVCASRDDPMPTFVAEGMMFGTPSICSENTGTAKVLEHGIDGLVYEKDDPALLADAIRQFIFLSTDSKAEMSRKARATFLREFEIEGFRRRFLKAIESCIAKDHENLVFEYIMGK